MFPAYIQYGKNSTKKMNEVCQGSIKSPFFSLKLILSGELQQQQESYTVIIPLFYSFWQDKWDNSIVFRKDTVEVLQFSLIRCDL